MDWAKLGVFERNGNYYQSVTHATYNSLDKTLNERNYLFNFSRKSKAPAKVSWCLDNLCSIDKVSILHVDSLPHVDSSKQCAWNTGIEGVIWKQVSEHNWLCEDNL